MNRIDIYGMRLLKKKIRPERALSIGCQAFSLMNGMGAFYAGQPPSPAPFAFGIFPKRGKEKDRKILRGCALLLQGLRPISLRVLREWMNIYSPVPTEESFKIAPQTFS